MRSPVPRPHDRRHPRTGSSLVLASDASSRSPRSRCRRRLVLHHDHPVDVVTATTPPIAARSRTSYRCRDVHATIDSSIVLVDVLGADVVRRIHPGWSGLQVRLSITYGTKSLGGSGVILRLPLATGSRPTPTAATRPHRGDQPGDADGKSPTRAAWPSVSSSRISAADLDVRVLVVTAVDAERSAIADLLADDSPHSVIQRRRGAGSGRAAWNGHGARDANPSISSCPPASVGGFAPNSEPGGIAVASSNRAAGRLWGPETVDGFEPASRPRLRGRAAMTSTPGPSTVELRRHRCSGHLGSRSRSPYATSSPVPPGRPTLLVGLLDPDALLARRHGGRRGRRRGGPVPSLTLRPRCGPSRTWSVRATVRRGASSEALDALGRAVHSDPGRPGDRLRPHASDEYVTTHARSMAYSPCPNDTFVFLRVVARPARRRPSPSMSPTRPTG